MKNMIFKIILSVLVLYLSYKAVNKQLESINTIVYSLKRSQGQRFLKIQRNGLFLQCFYIVMQCKMHYDAKKEWSCGWRYMNHTLLSHIKCV